MGEWIAEFLVKNMKIIKEAPLAFAVFLGMGCLFGWFVSDQIIIQGKNATIEAKDAQIELFKDSRQTVKILFFDSSGEIIFDAGAEKLVKNFKVEGDPPCPQY